MNEANNIEGMLLVMFYVKIIHSLTIHLGYSINCVLKFLLKLSAS